MKQNGEKTGSSGGKTNGNANLEMNDGKKNYFIPVKKTLSLCASVLKTYQKKKDHLMTPQLLTDLTVADICDVLPNALQNAQSREREPVDLDFRVSVLGSN